MLKSFNKCLSLFIIVSLLFSDIATAMKENLPGNTQDNISRVGIKLKAPLLASSSPTSPKDFPEEEIKRDISFSTLSNLPSEQSSDSVIIPIEEEIPSSISFLSNLPNNSSEQSPDSIIIRIEEDELRERESEKQMIVYTPSGLARLTPESFPPQNEDLFESAVKPAANANTPLSPADLFTFLKNNSKAKSQFLKFKPHVTEEKNTQTETPSFAFILAGWATSIEGIPTTIYTGSFLSIEQAPFLKELIMGNTALSCISVNGFPPRWAKDGINPPLMGFCPVVFMDGLKKNFSSSWQMIGTTEKSLENFHSFLLSSPIYREIDLKIKSEATFARQHFKKQLKDLRNFLWRASEKDIDQIDREIKEMKRKTSLSSEVDAEEGVNNQTFRILSYLFSLEELMQKGHEQITSPDETWIKRILGRPSSLMSFLSQTRLEWPGTKSVISAFLASALVYSGWELAALPFLCFSTFAANSQQRYVRTNICATHRLPLKEAKNELNCSACKREHLIRFVKKVRKKVEMMSPDLLLVFQETLRNSGNR